MQGLLHIFTLTLLTFIEATVQQSHLCLMVMCEQVCSVLVGFAGYAHMTNIWNMKILMLKHKRLLKTCAEFSSVSWGSVPCRGYPNFTPSLNQRVACCVLEEVETRARLQHARGVYGHDHPPSNLLSRRREKKTAQGEFLKVKDNKRLHGKTRYFCTACL